MDSMKNRDPKFFRERSQCRESRPVPLVIRICLVAMLALFWACTSPSTEQTPVAPGSDPAAVFKQRIDHLRQRYDIPGLSLGVVFRQKILFAQGFGHADLENNIAATPDTPYHIASLTKPFAAAVIMKLVEAGRLDLDDKLSVLLEKETFSRGNRTFHGHGDACDQIKEKSRDASFKYLSLIRDYRCDTEPITVRHHLTHTSQGQPGQHYRYNGYLFGFLSSVIRVASGTPYKEMLVETIVRPLNMARTFPSWDDELEKRTLADRAVYYRKTAFGFSRSAYPARLSASAGMVSTVTDLARFDAAMDRDLIVSSESRNAMFSPGLTAEGKPLPYGLGWFVQTHGRMKLVWHYGHAPNAYSSLILKIPDREYTLILLANSDGLSRRFGLGKGDVTTSPFARAFFEYMAATVFHGSEL